MGDLQAHNRRIMDEAERPRCESRLRVGTRSWRCVNDAGHPGTVKDGGHAASARSGRRW